MAVTTTIGKIHHRYLEHSSSCEGLRGGPTTKEGREAHPHNEEIKEHTRQDEIRI